MTNFDGTIDDGFEEILQAEPGKVFGRHAGHFFNGCVYFLDGRFYEEIWVYGTRMETINATTLRDLMNAVCNKYGYD